MSVIEFTMEYFERPPTPARRALPAPTVDRTSEEITARIVRDLGITLQTANDIAKRLAARLGLTVDEFFTEDRRPALVRARRRLYVELQADGWSLSEIARFARRDHGTISAAINGRRKPANDSNLGPGVRKADVDVPNEQG